MEKHIGEEKDHLYLPILTQFSDMTFEFKELKRRAEEVTYAITDFNLMIEKVKRKGAFKRRNSRRDFYLN